MLIKIPLLKSYNLVNMSFWKNDPIGRPAWEVEDLFKWRGAVLEATSVLVNIGIKNEEEMLLSHSELQEILQEKIDNNLLSDTVIYKDLKWGISTTELNWFCAIRKEN